MNIKSLLSFVTRLSVRERIILYVTLGVVSMVLVDRMVLTPIFSKITYLSEAIEEQEQVIEQSLLFVTQEKRSEGESSRYASYLSQSQSEEKITTAFLKEVEGVEEISNLFCYKARLATDDSNVDFSLLVGKSVLININIESNKKRYISGIVSRLVQEETGDDNSYYLAEIRPWLWFLTLTGTSKYSLAI